MREGLILLPHWESPRPPPVQLTGLGISVVLMTIITSKGYESKLTKEKMGHNLEETRHKLLRFPTQ